jgi:predicted anti-sigma-YlaC factor YlaD
MPEEIREHIHDCSDCRSFIKRWNAVEAGLMSMRGAAPQLSPDFSHSLHARLRAGQVKRERMRVPVKWTFAVAGASSLAVLVLLVLYLVGAKHSGVPALSGAAYANGRPGGSVPDSPSPFSNLPLANTGR